VVCGGMSILICKNAITFLELELVHHFIDGTGIGSSTTATNATTALYCTRSRSGTASSTVQLSDTGS
jgi:hypothetical protein